MVSFRATILFRSASFISTTMLVFTKLNVSLKLLDGFLIIFFTLDTISTKLNGTISILNFSSSSPSLQITVQKSPGLTPIWPILIFLKFFTTFAAIAKLLNPLLKISLSIVELII